MPPALRPNPLPLCMCRSTTKACTESVRIPSSFISMFDQTLDYKDPSWVVRSQLASLKWTKSEFIHIVLDAHVLPHAKKTICTTRNVLTKCFYKKKGCVIWVIYYLHVMISHAHDVVDKCISSSSSCPSLFSAATWHATSSHNPSSCCFLPPPPPCIKILNA